MTAVVTGATGFLGSALVAELMRRHQSVRVLARDLTKARQRFGDSVEIIGGDIMHPDTVRQAVDGASTIYHLAGRLYHPSLPTDLYHRTHVEGTRNLLEACQGQTQLERVVYVSTTGVHGVTGERPAGEDAPYAPTNPYETTKLAGELMAQKARRDQALPVTVVRPGLVYGPGDLHLLGFFKSIDRGLFRVIAGGKALLHPIYIDDVVGTLLLCADRTETLGRTYNIAAERPVTVRELAEAAARALGKELPRGSIPLWLARVASGLFAVIPGANGDRAPLTKSRVDFLTKNRVYDIRRAKSEFGFAPRVGLEEGMQLTVEWYVRHGYLIGSATSLARVL